MIFTNMHIYIFITNQQEKDEIQGLIQKYICICAYICDLFTWFLECHFACVSDRAANSVGRSVCECLHSLLIVGHSHHQLTKNPLQILIQKHNTHTKKRFTVSREEE